MTSHQKADFCEDVLPYLLGQLTPEDQVQFEEHLQTCISCRQEVSEVGDFMQSLPHTLKIVAPPQELRDKVLQSAFALRPPTRAYQSWRTFWNHRYAKVSIALVAILSVLLTGTIFSITSLQSELASVALQRSTTDQVQRTYPIVSVRDIQNPVGMAYVTKTNSGMKLVVQVHAAQLTGNEVYQVWLVKDGQRQNAGTFRVDPDGNGVLVFSSGQHMPPFDSIGITREPDSKGNSPRGPKVMGSQI